MTTLASRIDRLERTNHVDGNSQLPMFIWCPHDADCDALVAAAEAANPDRRVNSFSWLLPVE